MFKSDRRILGAAGINLTFQFLGKGLNYFALSILVAFFFGASWITDSYVMGGIIPFWTMTVILYGFNSCLIPVFIYYKKKYGNKNAQTMAVSFYTIALIGLSFIILAGMSSASSLIPIYSPGFNADGIKLAVSIAHWIFFSLIFNFTANFLSSIYYSYHKYLIPAVGNLILPLMIIINMILLNESIGIFSLVSGLISGQILQILWLLIKIKKVYSLDRLKWDFNHPGIRKVLNLFIPIAISGSIYPLFIIITRMLASTLGEGSIANLDFATKIVLGIMLTVSSAISVSILPTLSELEVLKEKNKEELNRAISTGVSILSFILVPIAFILILFRLPIVRLLLERGAFHFEDSLITAQVLSFLAILMLLEPINIVFIQVMFALKDTVRLIIATSSGFFINVLSAIILVNPLGIKGLALSFPLGVFVQMVILYFIIKSKLKYDDEKNIIIPYLKVFLAASIMIGVIAISNSAIGNMAPSVDAKLALFMNTGISILIGGIAYICCLYLLGFRELRLFWSVVKEKTRGKNNLNIA